MTAKPVRPRTGFELDASYSSLLRQSHDSREVFILVAAVPLLACAGALPRLIQVGGLTPVGVLSFVFCLSAIAVLVRHPITAPTAVPVAGVWSLLVLWVLLSMVARGVSIAGVQETTAIALAPLLILLSAGQAWLRQDWYGKVERIMTLEFWGLIIVAVVQWLAFAATRDDTLNIRPVAMSAVFLGVWYMGRYIVAGTGIARMVALGLLVTLSLSRMAFAIYLICSLCAVIARSFRARGPARAGARRGAVAFILLVTVGLGLLLVWGPLHTRSSQGDVSLKVLGVPINGEGRAAFWQTLRNDSNGVGITGLGAGAAEELIAANFPGVGQPHNDYLKLWFDLGWGGVALFVGGWAVACQKLIRASRAGRLGPNEQAVSAAALLSVMALLIFMVTDNPIAYAPITGQWALIVGASLGFIGRARASDRSLLVPDTPLDQLFGPRSTTGV